MHHSRRDVLRAGAGAFGVAGLAGCIEQRVTRRETRVETTPTWRLTPAVGASLDQAAFDEYTGAMADRYGDAGVWGLDGDAGQGIETAYVARLVLSRETPAEPGGTESSLDPETVDPDAPLLFVDACVAAYHVEADRHRYWLWVGADAGDDRLVRDVQVSTLGVRAAPRDGVVVDTAQVSAGGGEATASLGAPPSGSFPLADGTAGVDSNSRRGADGYYAVDWSGSVDGQSINGVLEEERDGEHDLTWAVTAGYRFEETL